MSSTTVASHDLNIAGHLTAMARREPYRLAVVVPSGRDRSGRVRYTHFTYRQLDQDSDQIAAGLRAIGLARGARTIVMVRPGLDFFSLVFALFKAGLVPVLIDPGIGLKSLGQCCLEAAPDVFIGIPRAVLAQRILGWGGKSVRQIIQAGGARAPMGRRGLIRLDEVRDRGRNSRDQGRTHGSRPAVFSPTEPAAILFTSGSTGPPKGAVYTHAIFQAQVEILRGLFAIEPGEIDLCTFPLFALFVPALGMTAIVPDMDPTRPALANPARLIEAIEDFGVTNLFGSPALLRRLAARDAAVTGKLSTLKRIISAGAPISARTLEQLAPQLVFPTEVHPTYGATESLPVATIGSREILDETRLLTDIGKGVCVGRPVDGIEVKIIAIRDDPIPTWSDDLIAPQGDIGEIVVAGAVVTREYFNRPEATSMAKILDPTGQLVIHRMGDLGYFDDRGRLWFCGRKSQRVILPGETLFTIPCEAIFNSHPDVARSALVGATLRGQVVPVICIEPNRRLARSQRDVLRQELLDRASGFARTSKIRTILFHRSFPVRHPPQCQDISREARPLGVEEIIMSRVEIGPVLVTGGGGFLGTALVRMLHERGVPVRSLARRYYRHLEKLEAEQVQGAIADPAVVAAAVAGCKTVFHTAAKAGIWGAAEEYQETNVEGTRNVVAASRLAGVERIIFTSSPSVVFNGKDLAGVDESAPYSSRFEAAYPRTKVRAEQIVLQANGPDLATVSIRPHLIWGPGDNNLLPRIIARAKRGQLRRIGRSDPLVDPVYIDNAADAHILAAERLHAGSAIGGRSYFVTQGQTIPLWEMVNRMLAAAKLPPICRTVSLPLAIAAAGVLELTYSLSRRSQEPPMTRFLARQLSTTHWFKIDAARRDLDYEPKVSIDEGLSRLERWLSEGSGV